MNVEDIKGVVLGLGKLEPTDRLRRKSIKFHGVDRWADEGMEWDFDKGEYVKKGV